MAWSLPASLWVLPSLSYNFLMGKQTYRVCAVFIGEIFAIRWRTPIFFYSTDIVLGFKDLEGEFKRCLLCLWCHLNPQSTPKTDYHTNSPYIGCSVGRVANRIRDSTFTIEGQTYTVSANVAPHTLHGGAVGFNKVITCMFFALVYLDQHTWSSSWFYTSWC